MSSIVTAVFKATVGLLVNKGRDKAAEKLKDGDVTDQKFRGLIVREIETIKEKLGGLSRKDLLASISFFEEGIEFLYEVFDKARPRSEYSAVTTQAACVEAFSLAEGMGNLELTDLGKSATRALSNAKKRFRDARRKATEAFRNEALSTSDRILAMQYRVMATILETVDNPVDAVAPCRVCIKELNSLSAVRKSFNVQLEKGLGVRCLFGKYERMEIFSGVCHVNRMIHDVTQTVGKDVHLLIWPAVDIEGDKVDPLRDGRVTEVLRKQGMEYCCVTPWSFGQEGEKDHMLKEPSSIATNSSGQFIVGDRSNVNIFDSTGTFINLFSLPNDDLNAELHVRDVATDMNDNIYVLVGFDKPIARYEHAVYQFNQTVNLHHKFPVGTANWKRNNRLTVTDSGKVLVLKGYEVDVYERDGQFVRSFGKGILDGACDITTANNGRIMVADWGCFCVHIFSENGVHINKFKLHVGCAEPRIAFHCASESVVVAGVAGEKDLRVEIYTKDGEYVRSTEIHDEGICRGNFAGMTVTTEGRIAVACNRKVLVM